MLKILQEKSREYKDDDYQNSLPKREERDACNS